MITNSLMFFAGLFFLISGTATFVKFAKILAKKLSISPLIVGVTIVALGTSLPEFAVSVISSLKGDYGLAVGNIVGSNVSNVLLVLPVAIFAGKLRIGTTKTQKTALIVVLATLVYFLLHFLKFSFPVIPVTLLSLAVFITFLEYRWGVDGASNEDRKFIDKLAAEENLKFSSVINAVWGIAGIMLGGYLVVVAVEQTSIILGLSTTILGLSLTAVATSLPELVTTIFAQSENEEKMAIGNILGSNIYNILFIGGVSSIFHGSLKMPVGDWLWMIGTSLMSLLIVRFYSGKVVPKFLGFVLLALMVAYLSGLYFIK